jgi:hypothetical protein
MRESKRESKKFQSPDGDSLVFYYDGNGKATPKFLRVVSVP